MCFFVAAFAFWNTISLLSKTAQDSVKYLRIADGFALFIPVTFLHFAMHFSGRFRPRLLKISYALTGLIALTVGTPWFVQEGQWKFGIWFEKGGPTFALFALIFVLLPAYGIYLLWQAAKRSTGFKRAQLSCLILATSLGFGGGFMWFPPAFGIDIPPLGAHIIALYCIIVGYAIVRYQFLDIQVVIRKSIIYSLLVTFLTIGYFGALYLIEHAFQARMGYRSPIVSVAAFALMAVAFQPLKVGIQRLVDWLIFRVPQEALAKRVERLEEQALQAEKLKAVSTLAAGMAHEIKGPLTGLMAYTEFLPERHQDKEFVEDCHRVFTQELKRIHGFVQDVLSFAKPKPPKFEPIDIGSLISSTVNLLSGELLKHRVQWAINCQHNGSTVQADSNQLRQVLINLIQNACEAMPQGGSLTIATQANNGHLELTISDTGEGMPKELLPKIFDPFVTTKDSGNGLGLAMVRSIIQSHRGTIHADSTPNLGTTFTVRLPL
jgi:signal transduction histidine kinase